MSDGGPSRGIRWTRFRDTGAPCGGSLTKADTHPSSSCPRWWQVPGSLRNRLLRLDGQVGTAVNAEEHVADPRWISGELAGQLVRTAQLPGDGVVAPSDREFAFEPAKPSFTREVGSFRRRGSPPGVRDPGE